MLRLTTLLCVAIFTVMLLAKTGVGTNESAAPSVPQTLPNQSNVESVSYTPSATNTPIVMPLTLPLVQPGSVIATTANVSPATVWYVKGSSVNVRQGPSTEYTVVGKLGRGEAATVLSTEANGWAHILIEGDGIDGYVSTDFLAQDAP